MENLEEITRGQIISAIKDTMDFLTPTLLM